MFRSIRYWINAFLTLKRGEQNGILIFTMLILMVLAADLFLPSDHHSHPPEDTIWTAQVARFRAEQQYLEDSMALDRLQSAGMLPDSLAPVRIHARPFDPNTLSDSGWMSMGFTRSQALLITRYRQNGGLFRRAEDLSRMFCLSAGEYALLAPMAQIADSLKPTRWKNPAYSGQRARTEINSADSTMLSLRLRIPAWLAANICTYRERLGGYRSEKQLLEVSGMKEDLYTQLVPWVLVDTSAIRPLDINHITFSELLKHPYWHYPEVLRLMETRRKISTFTHIREVQRAAHLSDSAFAIVRPYLRIVR